MNTITIRTLYDPYDVELTREQIAALTRLQNATVSGANHFLESVHEHHEAALDGVPLKLAARDASGLTVITVTIERHQPQKLAA